MTYAAEVLTDVPLAYWRMGDASGTTATDSSGNARNGTYVSNFALGATGLLAGDADTCVDFTTGGAVVLSPAAWMDVDYYTIEAWINLDTTFSTLTVATYAFGFDVNQLAWSLQVTSTGKLLMTMRNSSTTVGTATGATTLSTLTTYHVAATYDGTTIKVYVNGVLDGSGSLSGVTNKPTHVDRKFSIGRMPSIDAFLDGRVDEVAFHGSALGESRIFAHYVAGIATSQVATAGGATWNRGPRLLPSFAGSIDDVPTLVGRVVLVTALGDDTTAGTEVAGGLYAPFAPKWTTRTTSSPGVRHHGGGVTINGMPACTVKGFEGWSADGTTRYLHSVFEPQIGNVDGATNSVLLTYPSAPIGDDIDSGPQDGLAVVFQPGHAPTGLTAGTTYYQRDVTAKPSYPWNRSFVASFRLAATLGGVALDITAADGQEVVFGHVLDVATGDEFTFGQFSVELA